MDLEALVTDELREEVAAYSLEWFDVEASSRRPPHATVGVTLPDGTSAVRARSPATGPWTRSSARSTRRPGIDAQLREFRVDAVTGGQDALGETCVVLELEGQSASGQGVATDILEAAGVAYVRALSNVVRKVARSPRRRRPCADGRARGHARSGRRLGRGAVALSAQPCGAARGARARPAGP